MTKSLLCTLAFSGALIFPQRAVAQDAYDAHLFAAADNMEFAGGLDFLTAYYFRGILQKKNKLIMQPWFNVTATEVASGDLIENLDIGVRNWNSIEFDSAGKGDKWFRSDLSLLFSMELDDEWNVEVAYSWYKSPNGAFKTVTELAFDVSYKDEGGLNPSGVLAFEIEGGSDGVSPAGVFLGLGIEPATEAGDNIDVTFPVRLGLSLRDYYQDKKSKDDSFFGYLEGGVEAKIPVDLFGDEYGTWYFGVGLHILLLGQSLAALNNDTSFDIFGFAGLTFTF